MGGRDADLEAIAGNILNAIQNKDASSLAGALHDFFDAIDED